MCLEKIGKIFLIAVNIGFFLGGGALLAVGLISIFKDELLYQLTDLITNNLGDVFKELDVVAGIDFVGLIKTNAIIICVVGGFLFALGFLGMCGACKSNSTCLMIYAVIVLVLLLAEVGLGVYAYMNAEQFEGKIQTGLLLALSKTYEGGYRVNTTAPNYLTSQANAEELGFDLLQMYLGCCGVNNASNWQDSATKWNNSYSGITNNAKVPPSCCVIAKKENLNANNLQTIPKDTFTNMDTCIMQGTGVTVNDKPCYDELRSIILKNQDIIIIVFVIIVAVQIVAVSCACYLKNNADKK